MSAMLTIEQWEELKASYEVYHNWCERARKHGWQFCQHTFDLKRSIFTLNKNGIIFYILSPEIKWPEVEEYSIASELYEPEEGDYTTEDHSNFYQYGKCVLVVHADEDWEKKIKEHMDKNKFWPNVWLISDHGNAHLLSLD